ncbi:MAG: M23 family metallopeptidase [Proteobacteria bacterium]|nr:M23 family metallopeptidase [Pseudomonadota bacterium]MCP4918473.1 M23 family metallopeptidase [Pseudomonadota bacterium]
MIWLVACTSTPTLDSAGDSSVPRSPLQFALPLADPEAFGDTIGVDHDPDVYEGIERLICLAYDGRPFPACYDEHNGSDYLLLGAFEAMDAGSSPVIAAADGVVVDTEDGNYDHCHGDAATGEVDCDGHPERANFVIVEHDGGVRSKYWHLMTDSVAVQVGDTVACGDTLGIVGSSGNSSTPHLHFQVELEGTPLDPYAGEYSQPETWWIDQGEPGDLPTSGCP